MKVCTLTVAIIASTISTALAAGPARVETVQCGDTLQEGTVTELKANLVCENDSGLPALILSQGATLKGNGHVIFGRSGTPSSAFNKPLEEVKEDDAMDAAILIPKGVDARVEGLKIKGFETGILSQGLSAVEVVDVRFEQLKNAGLIVQAPVAAPYNAPKLPEEMELDAPKLISVTDAKFESIGVKAIEIDQVYAELNLVRTKISNVGYLATPEEIPAGVKLSPLQPQVAQTTHTLKDVEISSIKGTGILIDLPKYQKVEMTIEDGPLYPEVTLRVEGETMIDFIEGKALELGRFALDTEEKQLMSEKVKLVVAPGSKLEVTAGAWGLNLEKATLKLEAQAECKICQNGPLYEQDAQQDGPGPADAPLYDLEIPEYATLAQFEIDSTAKLYFDDKDGIFKQEKDIKDTLELCEPFRQVTVVLADEA